MLTIVWVVTAVVVMVMGKAIVEDAMVDIPLEAGALRTIAK